MHYSVCELFLQTAIWLLENVVVGHDAFAGQMPQEGLISGCRVSRRGRDSGFPRVDRISGLLVLPPRLPH